MQVANFCTFLPQLLPFSVVYLVFATNVGYAQKGQSNDFVEPVTVGTGKSLNNGNLATNVLATPEKNLAHKTSTMRAPTPIRTQPIASPLTQKLEQVLPNLLWKQSRAGGFLWKLPKLMQVARQQHVVAQTQPLRIANKSTTICNFSAVRTTFSQTANQLHNSTHFPQGQCCEKTFRRMLLQRQQAH